MATAAALEKRQHLKGRWKIEGRQLRYEAGADICHATLQILKEYVADCESEYFCAVHDTDLPQVKVLIERGEAIIRGDYDLEPGDLPAWATWLRSVANLIPYLWD